MFNEFLRGVVRDCVEGAPMPDPETPEAAAERVWAEIHARQRGDNKAHPWGVWVREHLAAEMRKREDAARAEGAAAEREACAAEALAAREASPSGVIRETHWNECCTKLYDAIRERGQG